MSYCSGKKKAIVTYTSTSPGKKRVSYESNQVPVSINIKSQTQGTYRFYGIGDDNVFYQFTATGINPGYAINIGFNSRGVTPTMNGVFLKTQEYYYVSGYGIQEIVKAEDNCKIQISGSGNNFSDAIECPDGNYQVSCDDECPDGYCKIECETYPGYCCINEAEIQSLSNQLR